MGEADGLMAFYADIETANVEDYRRWHNCEHMAERVAIDGFLRGRRYCGYGSAPDFLMTYETVDAAALGSPAYHAALNAPTPWTRTALTWFRRPARAIYTRLATVGEAPAQPAPYLVTARFNIADTVDATFRETTAPALMKSAVDGAAIPRARLYAVDEAISGMMTSERKIYGGGPGEQKYLLMVEIGLPFDEVPSGRLPDDGVIAGAGGTHVFVDRFSIDFALEAAA